MVRITPGAIAPQVEDDDDEPIPPPPPPDDDGGDGGGGTSPPPPGIDIGLQFDLPEPEDEELDIQAVVISWRSEFSSFEQTVVLSGRRYRLRSKWNTVHEYWSLDILDGSSNEPIITGLKVIVGVELLNRYNDERLPPGQLIAVDMSGSIQRIGRNDMGNRVQLIYATV